MAGKHLIVDEDVLESTIPSSDRYGVWCDCGRSFFGRTRDRAMVGFYDHL